MTVMEHPHNFGRICLNGCQNYHIVNGESACNVTGERLTTTKIRVIYNVGCASYIGKDCPRPYKSDDAVLDDFVDWCRDAISSLEEKQCDGYKQFADVVKIELLHHELKIIKELRLQQKGGGER